MTVVMVVVMVMMVITNHNSQYHNPMCQEASGWWDLAIVGEAHCWQVDGL